MAGVKETVRAMWQGYRRAVIPADAPPVQIIECRRAFYGGAWALLTRLAANAEANMPDADAVAYLKQLTEEQERFKQAVGTPLEGRE